MATIAKDVIFIWSGTNATIPSGWTRETDLDGIYPKGTADETNPDTTGGATTHTHTSLSHTHNIAAHTHTYTTSVANPVGNAGAPGSGITQNHTHTGTSGAASTGTTQETAVTYGSVSNDPPYYTVIYVKSNGGSSIATNMIGLWDNSDLPDNWNFCNGSSSTPDLRNKYLKGAETEADGGSTGGSVTNQHNITHTHTAQTHTHTGTTSSGPTASQSESGSLQAGFSSNAHTHTVTLSAGTQNINQNTDTLTTSETVEPAYTKLVPIQKTASGIAVVGLIGMWLGTLASIPAGWILCDGTSDTKDMRGRHLKCANATTESGDTGGANTHTHTAQAHSHTGNGTHTHTGTVSDHTDTATRSNSPQSQPAHYYTDSQHTVTSDTATANYENANTTAESSSNEPAYRTVAFIKLNSITGGASFLLNFLDNL